MSKVETPTGEPQLVTEATPKTATFETSLAVDEAMAAADNASVEALPMNDEPTDTDTDAAAAPDAADDSVTADGDAAAEETIEEVEMDDEQIKELLQTNIREMLNDPANKDLSLASVKDKLRDQIGREAVKEYRDFIKEFVIAEAKRLAHEGDDDDVEPPADIEDAIDRGDDDEYEERKPKRKAGGGIPKKDGAKAGKRSALPVGSRSAYLLYSQSQRESLKRDNPDASFGDISKLIAAEWRELSDDDKAHWQQKSAEDKARYKREMAELQQRDPAAYERALDDANSKGSKRKKKRTADSDGDDESSQRRRSKKKRRSDEDAETGGADDQPEEKKELSYFDAIVERLKSKRSKGSQYDENDSVEMCKRFIHRMEQAWRRDQDCLDNDQPAIHKVSMLSEVATQVAKKEVADKLIDSGLLAVIKKWLTPLPDGSLPNIRLRTTFYKILDSLPITELDLEKSNGLGHIVMLAWEHEDETPENKKFLASLLEKWMRPMLGLKSGYKHLADVERMRAREIQMRNASLVTVRTPTINTGRARIPQPANFDYAIRPTSLVERGSDDEEDERKARRDDDESRRVKMSKRLDRMKKSASVAGRARYKVDISGSKAGTS